MMRIMTEVKTTVELLATFLQRDDRVLKGVVVQEKDGDIGMLWVDEGELLGWTPIPSNKLKDRAN